MKIRQLHAGEDKLATAADGGKSSSLANSASYDSTRTTTIRPKQQQPKRSTADGGWRLFGALLPSLLLWLAVAPSTGAAVAPNSDSIATISGEEASSSSSTSSTPLHRLRGRREEGMAVSLASHPQEEKREKVTSSTPKESEAFESTSSSLLPQGWEGVEDYGGVEDVDLESWFKDLELPEDFNPNDYNMTFYDEETGEEFTEQEFFTSSSADRRRNDRNLGGRNLISVTSNEFKNAKFIQYERVSRGLGGVGWSTDLIQQAQMWARYMASSGDFEHRSKLAAGVKPGWRYIAENIAMNTNIDRNGAHRSLMNSPGHRANILSTRISRLGIGVARSRDGYYYMCQIFKGF